MGAVNIDDAWGDSMMAAAPPPPRPQSPQHHHQEARPKRRSGRRSLLDEEMRADELEAFARAIAMLSGELKEWKAVCHEQQRVQRTTLYAAVAVVVILLMFVAHSYSRLSYATDCLVHYRR